MYSTYHGQSIHIVCCFRTGRGSAWGLWRPVLTSAGKGGILGPYSLYLVALAVPTNNALGSWRTPELSQFDGELLQLSSSYRVYTSSSHSLNVCPWPFTVPAGSSSHSQPGTQTKACSLRQCGNFPCIMLREALESNLLGRTGMLSCDPS